MGINQPKKGSALVWAYDLMRQLKLSDIPSSDVRKIMSQVSKLEIVLPNGKKAFLVDYHEFIEVIENVQPKKASEKKVVREDKKNLRQKRKEIDKEKVIKDLRTIFYPVKQMKAYRESLYIENEYEEALKKAEEDKLELEQRKQVYSQPVFIDNRADYEKKDKRIVIPSIEEILRTTIIPEPKFDDTIDYFDDDYVYDEEEIDERFEMPHFKRKQVADEPILLNEKKRIRFNPEMIRSAWNCFENRFLNYMGLATLEELPEKKEKKKFEFTKIFRKAEKKEEELTPFENKLLDFLGLNEEEEDLVCKEAPLMDQQVKKEEKETIIKKSKNYRNEKKRNKDVKYKVYLLCQKLCNKNINHFSLNEKIEMIQASEKYIHLLKKGEENLFEYEKEYALLIVNKIHDYLNSSLNSFTVVYDEKIFNYMNSYIVEMKDYFEIESKHKIINFKISRETRNRIIKNMSKVASLALIAALGIGAKGINSENKEKEVTGIEHAFTDSNMEKTISKMNIEELNSKIMHVNERINIEKHISENNITTNVLTKNDSVEKKVGDYLSIGESVQVLNGAQVYGMPLDLAYNTNGQKPYFGSSDTERTIRSIIIVNNQQVQKAYSSEELKHYLSLDYDIIGYQVDNQYSYDESGNYICSEGIYNSQSLVRKLDK